MKKRILPAVDASADPVFLILIDNLRYDQWKMIQPIPADLYRVQDDELYCGILPTATQYARNAIFAGLMPSEIESRFPQWWKNDEDEGRQEHARSGFPLIHTEKIPQRVQVLVYQDHQSQRRQGIGRVALNKMQNKLNVIVT